MVLLFCLSKNERKEHTCYLLFGSYAHSLFGGPVNVRNSEEKFGLFIYYATSTLAPRLLFQPFQPILNNLTALRHSHVPDAKNPHIRVIQQRPSLRFESVLFLFQAEGLIMAERLERWICHPEAPSSSPALTASLSSFFSGGSD